MELISSLPLLPIHISAVLLTLSVVVLADLYGLLWVLGIKERLSARYMRYFHVGTAIGLSAIILSGFGMFLQYSEYLLTLTAFRLKVLAVVFLIMNAFVIGAHIPLTTRQSFATVPKKEKYSLVASGLLSTASWIGALVAAQFLNL